MSSDELIASYVSDVVRLLPPAERADIALELRLLLTDEVAEASTATGSPSKVDEQFTLELLRRFGHPVEVAARYHPATGVVDQVDRRSLWTAAVAGVAVIVGLAVRTGLTRGATDGVLLTLRDLWVMTLLRAALWVGLLTAGFAASAWVRRHRRHPAVWTPRAVSRGAASRAGGIAGVVAGIAATALLIDPNVLVEFMSGGRATPEALGAFAYDANFLRWRAPVILALLAARLALQVVVIVRGGWYGTPAQINVALSLALCAVLGWTVLAGPVFQVVPTDQLVRVLLSAIVVGSLIGVGANLRRRRPHPPSKIRLREPKAS